ncbi:224_t:CDS:2 [Dentiscutata erythropus]|uniref:224_t:CDS:1 n=1 Tax=Dentiscutata erythropus TaxID=1348616 RepID=A0A9N8YRK2_9GLOM|nr:224_t:CDS:2 [Dentiscutata erythropus]
MSHLEDSNRTDNEAHVIQSSKIESTQKNKKAMMLQLLLMLFVDIGLPLILYFVLSKYLPTIWALVISGVPPTISVIIGFIFRRQVNLIGLLVVIGFIVGIILSVIEGDPRIFLLRDSFFTGVFGLSFIITLIPIKIGSFEMRPLIYYNAKNLGMANLKGLTEDEPIPDRKLVRVIIVFRSPTVDDAVYYGNIFLYSWLGCLALFTVLYSRYKQKKGEQLLKEEEEAAAAAAI